MSGSLRIIDSNATDTRMRQEGSYINAAAGSKGNVAKFLDVGLITGKSSAGVGSVIQQRKSMEKNEKRIERAKALADIIRTHEFPTTPEAPFFDYTMPTSALPSDVQSVLELLQQPNPVPEDDAQFARTVADRLADALNQAAEAQMHATNTIFVTAADGLGELAAGSRGR